jgi:hypothetical protein
MKASLCDARFNSTGSIHPINHNVIAATTQHAAEEWFSSAFSAFFKTCESAPAFVVHLIVQYPGPVRYLPCI